jgi:hypothetical protein
VTGNPLGKEITIEESTHIVGLRRATLVLILGTSYTVLHKALHALLPALGRFPVASAVTSTLWVVAALALALFAFTFLRELRPLDRALRDSLIGVVVFTGVVVLSKLPVLAIPSTGVGHRILFGGASTLNAIALLVFVVSLSRHLPGGSSLLAPLRLLTWGLGLTIALDLAAAGYLAVYLLAGREVPPLPLLQPLAMLSFVFTHAITLWFLILFWRVEDYSALMRR